MRLFKIRRDTAHRADEATRAREHAEAQLERVRAETPMYAALGRSLRELRERNHFAESIAATFREGRA